MTDEYRYVTDTGTVRHLKNPRKPEVDLATIPAPTRAMYASTSSLCGQAVNPIPNDSYLSRRRCYKCGELADPFTRAVENRWWERHQALPDGPGHWGMDSTDVY